MAYGIKCWDGSGQVVLDTSFWSGRLVYYNEVTAEGSVDLPDLSGHDSFQWGEVLEEGEKVDGPYYSLLHVTRSGTTISWTFASVNRALIIVCAYT